MGPGTVKGGYPRPVAGASVVGSGGQPGTSPATTMPVGRGTIEAEPMTSAAGDHAVLLRQGDAPRVLLLAEPGNVADTGRERIVVVPLDDDVETRIDGDALATWIAASFNGPTDAAEVPVPTWASAFGFVLLIVVIVFTVLGGAVAFGWLLDILGA